MRLECIREKTANGTTNQRSRKRTCGSRARQAAATLRQPAIGTTDQGSAPKRKTGR